MEITMLSMNAMRIFLKGHLKLMAAGMKHSRFSGKHLLQLASQHTGKQYKRGQYLLALQDLEQLS